MRSMFYVFHYIFTMEFPQKIGIYIYIYIYIYNHRVNSIFCLGYIYHN